MEESIFIKQQGRSNDVRPSFFEHVFEINEQSKSDSLNIAQYGILSVVPIVAMNKGIAKWMPKADEQKGSFEIGVEVLAQIVVMFLGLLFVHRFVTYFPPYSGVNYPELNPISSVLGVLMILLSLQTDLGEKIAILTERISETWEGKSKKKKKKKDEAPPPPSQSGQFPYGTTPVPMHPQQQQPLPDYGEPVMTSQQQMQPSAPQEFVPLPANAVGDAFGTSLASGW